MFCETCGCAIEEGDLFCSRCGQAQSGQRSVDPPRRCYRESQGRMIAGVCAGFAEYFKKDITLVRIIWVIASVIPFLFPGIAAYLVCWMLMPMSPGALNIKTPVEHVVASE